MIIRYIAALWQWFGRQGYPCLFRLLTGFYCPGCGGTRALKYLLRGQVLTSLYYHPLVLYMAVTGAVEGWFWAMDGMKEAGGRKEEKHRESAAEGQSRAGVMEGQDKAGDRPVGHQGEKEGRKENRSRNRNRVYCRRQGRYEKEVYVGIGIILLNWAVKNWVLVVKGLSMIP